MNKHSFAAVLLHVCVLDRCVQTCFLTVGLSLGSTLTCGPGPHAWLPVLHACCSSSFFASPPLIFTLFFPYVVFRSVSTLLLPEVLTAIAQPLVAARLGFFFFFLDNVFELCGSREEHQKRYAAFNHANLDHFLLTA